MKIGIYIALGITIIVIVYLLINNSKNTSTANAVINQASAPCVPFTKSQQDKEKRDKEAKCLNKILIPFAGQFQIFTCLKDVKDSLTPVTDC